MEIDKKDLEIYFDKLNVGECLGIKTTGKSDDKTVELTGNVCRIDENTIKGKFFAPDKTSFEVEIKKGENE